MKKSRVPVSKDNAAEVLFLADRTCIVCTAPGKPVQIHHIDEDPANNDLDNLAVLCLDCHNQTMVKGGFGRQLDGYQIKKYRDEWTTRVKSRKEQADQHVILKKSAAMQYQQDKGQNLISFDHNALKDEQTNTICKLLNSLPVMEKAQKVIGKAKYSEGTTLAMNQSNGHMIGFYEDILYELAAFYPDKHFHPKGPKIYFRKMIADRFEYHRLVLEPYGVGTGGTIVSVNCGSLVAYDIKRMIVDLANTLTYTSQMEGMLSLENWSKNWLNYER